MTEEKVSFLVNIQIKSDKILTIKNPKCTPNMSVNKLKHLIKFECDMDSNTKFDLIFNSKNMELNKTLKECGIHDSRHLIKMVVKVSESKSYINPDIHALLNQLNESIKKQNQSLSKIIAIEGGYLNMYSICA